jgi:hypothetical protein
VSDHSPTIPTKLPGSPRVNNGEDVASRAPKTFFHAKHSEMALHSISGSVWNTNGLHTVTLGYNIFGLLMFSGLPMPVLPSNALQSVQSFAPAAQTH